jgi:hypothetical protein
VIVLAGVTAYGNSLSGEYLFDDETAILNNASIRQLGTALTPPRDTPVAGRPIVNLSLALNYAADGLDPTGYHVVNIVIHLAAALVLFGIVRRTLLLPKLADRWGPASADLALACGLVWALHPLNTEAVNYLTERTESLMGLWYLLTLYCSVRGWYVAAVVACALGMLCKESMATAPILVALYDRVFVFDGVREAFAARRRLYAGLAATWVILAAMLASEPRTSVGFDAGTSPWTYLLNQAELIPRYLWLSVWPRSLVLDYGLPRPLMASDVVIPGAMVVVLILVTLAALRYAPMIGFLGAWVFITLAPTSSIVPIATEVGAERRMYLPLAALAVLFVVTSYKGSGADLYGPPTRGSRGSLHRGPHGSAPLGWWAVIAIASVLLATGTFLRNREYRTRLTIAQTIVDRWPNGRGRFLLGSELIAAGRKDEAMVQLRASAGDYPGARFALGTELLADGKVVEAVEEIQAFLRAMPQHPSAAPAHDLLGRAYLAQQKFAEAAGEFQTLVDTAPSYRGPNNDVLLNLGYSLAAAGRLAESVPVLERAVAANPGNQAARDLLARVRGATATRPLTNPSN